MKLTATIFRKTFHLETKLRMYDGDAEEEQRRRRAETAQQVATHVLAAAMANPEGLSRLIGRVFGAPSRRGTFREDPNREHRPGNETDGSAVTHDVTRSTFLLMTGDVVPVRRIKTGLEALHWRSGGQLYLYTVEIDDAGEVSVKREAVDFHDAIASLRAYEWSMTDIEQNDPVLKVTSALTLAAPTIIEEMDAESASS